MKSLFSRLLISASLIAFILILTIWQWFQFSQDFNRDQVQQSLHKELALHMAHINPLLSQGITSDAALKEAFHDFMLLGPSFEIYTLDPLGQIIAYDANKEKIKRSHIATPPIEAFIHGEQLPIKGIDPRSSHSNKIFSATHLKDTSGKITGYLYVIIGGEDFDMWQSLVSEHQAPRIWGGMLLGVMVFSLILFALLARYLTSPLSKLEKDLRLVESQKLDEGLSLSHDYRGSLEVRQLSHHIKRLLNKISEQHQAINRQQQARHDFMLHLSHDLKTPLTSLQGYIDTWLLLPTNERSSDLIEVAAKSGNYIQQLLSQMLELAALENGQIEPDVKETELSLLLQELKLYFTPRADTQKVQLDFDLNLELSVLTDPQLLLRILSNLVDNAIRYTPSGGVVSIKVISAPTEAQQQSDHIWLSVSDNGSGMHKHELQALQQLRSKPSFKRNDALPQLGVGLAIVRQLLTLLQCNIDINSTPGEGSCFQIELEKI
ncbi:HAMP domain-containing histidine kinase [Shewanella eurypsychrophilus]|uniref:histidine kinase n=1 Tax=Shewanella eurypsychrophilus TaxID=2593656 RepID=A0ABX6V3G7_9GAMM|nr:MULTISPECIES: HAMP domain-containing sensor histidine kinase [Shewanella]QFU21039.1 sensor histidine kinase [Shewanella sp. YLB-09]QPG56328.1 HAMP domain-containing histidine kinase [Shewanella eurypsychrophilus]